MYLPDTNPVNVIPTLNCQFYLRKHYCQMLIGEDENDYLEPFSPVQCCELIVNTLQDKYVETEMEYDRKLASKMC